MKSWRNALCCVVCLGLGAGPAAAKVSRVEIGSRHQIADGRSFGNAGPYEEIVGRIYFEIDPAIAQNQVITDLDLAPRNNDGGVEMSADLSILAPVDVSRSNGIALVDIANRGRKLALRLNHAGAGNEYGDGFLMNRGYTVVWVGWEFDVPPSPAAIRIEVPRSQRAAGAPIGGLGFAAIRDAATWIKHSKDAVVSARDVLGFGVSQSGRFLRSYLYLGFNTDESGRKVFDGVIAHIAGASRIDLNQRGAEPISLGMFTATSFPFADQALRDPVTGVKEGALDNPRSRSNQPRIFYTNTSVEYWGGGRVAALVHSTPDGNRDIALPDNVRFYFLAGTQHGPGDFPPGPSKDAQQMENPTDYWWNMRALVAAMQAWLTKDIAPPPSVHPMIEHGTLVAAARIRFPAIPNVKSPAALTAGTRVANVLLADEGGAGAALPLLVPQVDADGNETSGIRHPEIAVPLATYTGWNFRKPEPGAADQLVPLAGSYIPFPATREERERLHDPRPSVEERYASRANYLEKVREAGEQLVRQRYLLKEDLAPILERAGQHWDLAVESRHE
jgi:Alpha/beta hydrolase domain